MKNKGKASKNNEISIDSNTSITPEFVKDLIKSIVLKSGPNVAKETKKSIYKTLVDIYVNGKSPKEAMNIKEEELRELYHYGHYLFNSGKYEEAREVFKWLYSIEVGNGDFATSIGVCHHRLKDYDNAITCYMCGAMLKPKDPVPFFYCYDCYLNLGMPDAAAIMLANVIERAGNQPEYAKIKQKAELLFEPLKKQVLEAKKQG